MKFSERRTYDMNCNWKTYIDNYLEGYHVPSVHPALNREINYSAYTVEPYPQYVRQWTPIRGSQPGDAAPRRYRADPAKISPPIISGSFPTGCSTAIPTMFR